MKKLTIEEIKPTLENFCALSMPIFSSLSAIALLAIVVFFAFLIAMIFLFASGLFAYGAMHIWEIYSVNSTLLNLIMCTFVSCLCSIASLVLLGGLVGLSIKAKESIMEKPNKG